MFSFVSQRTMYLKTFILSDKLQFMSEELWSTNSLLLGVKQSIQALPDIRARCLVLTFTQRQAAYILEHSNLNSSLNLIIHTFHTRSYPYVNKIQSHGKIHDRSIAINLWHKITMIAMNIILSLLLLHAMRKK